MTREEKILMAIEKGITCNPETGEVFGIRGNIIKSKHTDINKKIGENYIDIQFRDNDKRHHILAHHFIYYWVNKKCVDCIDHINMVRSDNRIENLRSITKQQNHFNNNAKGIYQVNSGKWVSRITLDYKQKIIGRFDTEEEARNAYLKAKEKYHQI